MNLSSSGFCHKECEKIDKYLVLARNKRVTVIAIVIDVRGNVTKGLERRRRRKLKIRRINTIGLMSRVFTNGPGKRGSIPGRVIPKSQKKVLDAPCSILSIIRYGSRVKWSTPGKGVAPSPTPQRSSYWKGSLRVTLDYGRQLYFVHSLLRSARILDICCPLDFNERRPANAGVKNFQVVIWLW